MIDHSVQRCKVHCATPNSDCNVAQLMRVTIERPELPAVNFLEVLKVFKEQNS